MLNFISWVYLSYVIINTLNSCHISFIHYNYMSSRLSQAFILFWPTNFVNSSYYPLYHYWLININFNPNMSIMTYPYNLKKKNSVCFWFVSNLHMLFFHSSIPYTQFVSFNYIFHLKYFLHSFISIFLFNLNVSRVYFWQVLLFFQLKYFSCLFISSYIIFSSW